MITPSSAFPHLLSLSPRRTPGPTRERGSLADTRFPSSRQNGRRPPSLRNRGPRGRLDGQRRLNSQGSRWRCFQDRETSHTTTWLWLVENASFQFFARQSLLPPRGLCLSRTEYAAPSAERLLLAGEHRQKRKKSSKIQKVGRVHRQVIDGSTGGAGGQQRRRAKQLRG